MRPFLALAFGLTTLLSPAAKADPVVVELFTSQGCSSCPPADAMLAELSGKEDIIPLALHVDYWDYIGWPDTFADPAFTARQKNYARVAGARSIFTPHLVVNGHAHVAGAKPMALADQIRTQMRAAKDVRLTVSQDAQEMTVTGSVLGADVGKMTLYLVTYIDQQTVPIAHGENAGKTITYTHIVRTWERLGTWDGVSSLTISLPKEVEEGRRVVLAQADRYGPIKAAVRVD